MSRSNSRMASPLNLTPGGSVSVPRNSFDMKHHQVFTSPAGMLLPAYVEDVMPNDFIKLDVSSFSRTMPVNTAAFSRFKEKCDFYFVPYRLLWRWYDQFLTGVTDWRSTVAPAAVAHGDGGGRIPSFTGDVMRQWFNINRVGGITDAMGFPIWRGGERLLDLLGYPVTNATDREFVDNRDFITTEEYYGGTNIAQYSFNPFRLLAYQYVYNQFYRQTDYIAAEANAFNIDDLDYNGVIDRVRLDKIMQPRYVQWRKDRLTSIKPTALTQFNNSGFFPNLADGVKLVNASSNLISSGTNATNFRGTFTSIPSNITSNSVQQVRSAFALDRVARLTMLTPKTIEAQMKAKFGVGTSDHCQARFLGAYESDLTIGEVTATSSGSAGQSFNVLGELAGKGISASKLNRPITHSFQEAGIIIGMHYFIPDAEYDSSFIDDFNSKIERSDYFMPEYDSLGMMPLMAKSVPYDCHYSTNPDVNPNLVLGYQARYLEYKTRLNKVHGLFQSKSSLRSWVTARNASLAANWSLSDLLVNPKITDSIFALAYDGSQSTDPFLCHYRFDATLVRDMGVLGLPSNNQTI